MFNILVKLFIKDYKLVNNLKVRQKYGVLCSIVSIILNLVLVVTKISAGFIINSITIVIDGLNNLSDMGSNLATLIGFKLSNIHPDKQHANGHGRYEYIVSFIISFLILFIGLESLISGVKKLFEPNISKFSLPAFIILLLAIIIKLYMAIINNNVGNLINSTALKAAGQDSFNDILTTFGALVGLLIGPFTKLPLDGFLGILIALYILKSGYELFTLTLSPLLGETGDLEVIKEIKDTLLNDPFILGVHDLKVHDYGVGVKFLSVHCEVDGHKDFIEAHDVIDNLELLIKNKYNFDATIHLDPIIVDDIKTSQIYDLIKGIIHEYNQDYDLNDFRVVWGPTHCNLIYNIEIPIEDKIDHEELIGVIDNLIKSRYPNYNSVIEISHKII